MAGATEIRNGVSTWHRRAEDLAAWHQVQFALTIAHRLSTVAEVPVLSATINYSTRNATFAHRHGLNAKSQGAHTDTGFGASIDALTLCIKTVSSTFSRGTTLRHLFLPYY